MVEKARPYFENPKSSLIEDLDKVCFQMKSSLENGDFSQFCNSLKDNQKLLDSANLSSRALDKLRAELEKDFHFLAVKQSGAGGGGVVMALLDDDHETAEKKLEAFRKYRPEAFVTSLEL